MKFNNPSYNFKNLGKISILGVSEFKWISPKVYPKGKWHYLKEFEQHPTNTFEYLKKLQE